MCNLRSTAAALLFVSAAAAFLAGPLVRLGHAHEDYSAGQPGNPKKPARIILITMREGDGRMMFIPDRVEVKRGEQIRFMISNNGLLEHEFILASTAENLKHAEAMKKNPDMEHDDPNGKRVASKKSSEMVWKFTKK